MSEYNLPSPIKEVAEETRQSVFFPPSAPPNSLSSGGTPLSPPCGPDPTSAPTSRRGSQQSMTGPQGFGGLPPSEPQNNPRRGSATGSYGLPGKTTLIIFELP